MSVDDVWTHCEELVFISIIVCEVSVLRLVFSQFEYQYKCTYFYITL